MTDNRENAATITLTADQLSELVANAVQSALRAAKPEAGSALPKAAAKDEKYLRYFEGKKEVALRYAAKKGEHYYVCRKPHSRKLMVWGDSTRATAKRRGQNPDETLGKVVWSTYEAGSLVDLAKTA